MTGSAVKVTIVVGVTGCVLAANRIIGTWRELFDRCSHQARYPLGEMTQAPECSLTAGSGGVNQEAVAWRAAACLARIYPFLQRREGVDDTPRQGPFILTRADGTPWFTLADESPLSDAWRIRMDAAGFYPKAWDDLTKDEKKGFLHFNDLRGTAVTLLAEAKCSVPMIASITGHTLQSATRILEKYLARTAALSEAAILMFENAAATAFANQLQTETPTLMGGVKKSK